MMQLRLGEFIERNGDELTKEEAEYQKVTEGSEIFIKVLLDAEEMIACLEAIITRTGGQTKTDKTFTLMHQPEPSGLKINFPKLQLPTFDGSITSFGMSLSHRLMNRPIYLTYVSLVT